MAAVSFCASQPGEGSKPPLQAHNADGVPPVSQRPHVVLWLSLAALAACHDPYMPVSPDDMSVGLPLMRWDHTTGTPLGQGRAGMPLALQPDSRALVGFGGTPTTQTDTWELSLRDDAWSTLILPAAPPPGRTGHCVAYVPAQNHIVLVGGHDDSKAAEDTPMIFTIGTPAYLDITGQAPRPYDGCAAAFAPVEVHAVVFGGATAAGTPSDETWLFDATSGVFSQASPAHSPPPRSGGTLVLDPGTGGATQHLLLFGGAGIGGELDDLWLWNGSDWAQVATQEDPDAGDTDDPRPLGRTNGAVALDPTRRVLYVFGGQRQGLYLDDLWRLDLRTTTWSRLHLGTGPSPRAQASVAFDPIGDRMLILGGVGDSGLLSDGWTLSPALMR